MRTAVAGQREEFERPGDRWVLYLRRDDPADPLVVSAPADAWAIEGGIASCLCGSHGR